MTEPAGTAGEGPNAEVPELIASTAEPFFTSGGETRATLKLHAPRGPALHRKPEALVVYLRVEHVTANNVAPTFSVYVNVPAGTDPVKHPDLFAGSMGMFGLPEASQQSSEHGGTGKNFTLDVTRLFQTLLHTGRWNPQELTLSFVPAPWDWDVPRLRIGRVGLYVQ